LNLLLAALLALSPLVSAAKMSTTGHGHHSMMAEKGDPAHQHRHHSGHAATVTSDVGDTTDSKATTHARGHSCDASGGCSSSCCAACAHCVAVVGSLMDTTGPQPAQHSPSGSTEFTTLSLSPQFRPPQN